MPGETGWGIHPIFAVPQPGELCSSSLSPWSQELGRDSTREGAALLISSLLCFPGGTFLLPHFLYMPCTPCQTWTPPHTTLHLPACEFCTACHTHIPTVFVIGTQHVAASVWTQVPAALVSKNLSSSGVSAHMVSPPLLPYLLCLFLGVCGIFLRCFFLFPAGLPYFAC